MSTWYMLLDPRFSVHPGPGRMVGGAMGSVAGRRRFSILTIVKSWIERQRAIQELQALDDRILNDIGISRFEIPAIVDGARTPANVRRFKTAPTPRVPDPNDEVLAA